MNWYYVDAGKQAGPIDDAGLEELMRTGKIQSETLIWREGMANWQPYNQARSAAPAPAPPPQTNPPLTGQSAAENICAVCGRIFPTADMIRHQNSHICSGCKPVFMQKLSEGVGHSLRPPVAVTSKEEVGARDYEHDIGGYFAQAWSLYKSNLGSMLGITLMIYFCMMLANGIPYLNYILGPLLTGPLLGGLLIFYLKKVRGRDTGMHDCFSGFGPNYGHLLLGYLVPNLLIFACMLPALMALIVGMVFMGVSQARVGGQFDISAFIPLFAITGLFTMAGFCAMMYFSVCWMYSLPLIAEKKYGFWAAMSFSRKVVRKHWWMNLLVLILIWLVASLGMVLGIIIGLAAGLIISAAADSPTAGIIAGGLLGVLASILATLLAAPVALGMFSYSYEKLFGDLAPEP